MTFGSRLKVARKNKNLTQKELGEMIGGVATSTINGYENDKTLPDAKKMYLMMLVLDVSADYLFQDETRNDVKIITFSPDERYIVDMYRQVNDFVKISVKTGLELEIKRMNDNKLANIDSPSLNTKDAVINLKSALENKENQEILRKIISDELLRSLPNIQE